MANREASYNYSAERNLVSKNKLQH